MPWPRFFLGIFKSLKIIWRYVTWIVLITAKRFLKFQQYSRFYIHESILKVQAKKLVKYEWNQFHEKLEECKQTADLYPGSHCLFVCVRNTIKNSCITFFDEISTFFCAIIIYNRCIFPKLWAPILMLYVQGVHFVNHWTRTAKLRNWQHWTPKLP